MMCDIFILVWCFAILVRFISVEPVLNRIDEYDSFNNGPVRGMHQWALYQNCKIPKQTSCWMGYCTVLQDGDMDCQCISKYGSKTISVAVRSSATFIPMIFAKICQPCTPKDCLSFLYCSTGLRTDTISKVFEICLFQGQGVPFLQSKDFHQEATFAEETHSHPVLLHILTKSDARKSLARRGVMIQESLFKGKPVQFRSILPFCHVFDRRAELRMNFQYDPTKHCRFTVAAPWPWVSSLKIVNKITENWKTHYGLEIQKFRYCEWTTVYVWKNSSSERDSMTTGEIYQIIFGEINGYYANFSSITSSRAFIDNSGDTMYCVNVLGCILMSVDYTSVTNNSAHRVPDSIDQIKLRLLLYLHQSNPIDVLQQTESCLTNKNTKLYFLIHGYRSNAENPWVETMKNALLSKNSTFAVVKVSWNTKHLLMYYRDAINAYAVASVLAHSIHKFFVKCQCVSASNVHIIGHSIGAHIAGITGNTFHRDHGEKLGKITGLDPAGPWFGNGGLDIRLDISDANYVEVFHTNARDINKNKTLKPIWAAIYDEYGVQDPAGHIDFYIDGGVQQSTCRNWSFIPCSHERSHDYFLESIKTNCKFIGFNCNGTTKKEQLSNCFKGNYTTAVRAVMGLHIPKVEHTGLYYVITTKNTSAFCNITIDELYPTP